MNKEYKYDAFISYRHTDLDMFVAKNLHKALETYELPKNVKEKLNIKGRTIKRIFRDQDELPLSSNLEDPIVEALNSSKYLIVICSPRLKESLWCKKEIETFKKLRGRKNIFCVLIEGEPEDSFPEEIMYEDKVTTDKNGKKKTTREYFEPLAADVRGEDRKEVLKKIKSEKLRLIAPMNNLDYDELKQRHKQRRMRKIITTSILVSAICVLITIYSFLTLLKISLQQKTLKRHQASFLVTESNQYYDNDSKKNAVRSAYNALTKFKGVKMPYTSEAEYALVESLGIYSAGNSFKAVSELKTKGVVDEIKISPNNKYLLTVDESEEITIWNIKNMKKIKSYSDLNIFVFNSEQFTFISDSKFAYISKTGDVKICSSKDGKVLHTIAKDSFKSISSDLEGKYILVNNGKELQLYDVNNYKIINKIKLEGKTSFSYKLRFTPDGKTIVVFSADDKTEFNKKVKSIVHIIDSNTFKEVDNFTIDAEYFENIDVLGDNIFILANQSADFNDIYAVIVSYDNKNYKVNYTKVLHDYFGKNIVTSAYEGANNFAVFHSNSADIFNASNGDLIRTFPTNGEIIGVFPSYSADIYLSFSTNGIVSFLSLKDKESIVYPGLFELNLNKYCNVLNNGKGYFLVPQYENRVIYYERYINKDASELDIKIEYAKDESLNTKETEEVKKTYNLKKKNLIKNMMYADNKKILVVSYTDNTAALYSVKGKKFLALVNNVDVLNKYFGKDKEGRLYIGNVSNAYIFSKNYELVGHIKSLAKLDEKNNKVIISNSGKYYSIPIYSYKNLLKEAKEYLNK